MKFTIFKLYFKTPLHIADEKQEYSITKTFIHSDTLISAFCSVLSQIGASLPQNCNFNFTISSLFPFYDNRYYLPVPQILKTVKLSGEQLENRKKYKKINWAEHQFFQELINGKKINEFDISFFKRDFLTTADDVDFMKKDIVPRVSVPRFAGETQIFFVEKIFFKPNSGLFFIVEGSNEDIRMIEKILKILQYNGLGTDKNLGFGRFSFEKAEFELDLPKSDKLMNLSIYLPDEKEKDFVLSAINYQLERRGGWITTAPFQSYRKNPIYMIKEAAVFEYKNSIKQPLVLGKTIDITPKILNNQNIKIYRSGKALFIPIKI